MGKGSSVRDGLSLRNRHTSLSGLFGRILPSNRAEQGGTAYGHDITEDSDSAYIDLGMNPNDLTGWNLARDQPLESRSRDTHIIGQQHERPVSGQQEGGSRLHDEIVRALETSQQAPSLDLSGSSRLREPLVPGHSPNSQSKKARPITRDEVRNMLKMKEAARKQRRGLKESGDWLGVQGADPHSGEFAVLTPTDTISSDTPPPSVKKRLADLSRKQRIAELAYEQAKLERETEREKLLLQKEQTKLEKIEHAKEEIRQQQQGFSTWSQHKRRWSSAAEPELSPIAQSINSCKLEGSPGEAAAATIHGPSRISNTIGISGADRPKPLGFELSGLSENTEPSRRGRRTDRSTDTIIHKTITNMEFPSMSRINARLLYPSMFSNTDNSQPQQKKEKSFLRRRRRTLTAPENLVNHSNPLMTGSSVESIEGKPAFNTIGAHPSLPPLQLGQELGDHFSDLLVPDYRLHLVPCLGQMTSAEQLPALAQKDPSPVTSITPTKSHSEAQDGTTSGIAANISDRQQTSPIVTQPTPDTESVTAISSQLKLKESMKPPLIHQSLIPTRNSSFQTKLFLAKASKIPIQSTGHIRSRFGTDPIGIAAKPRSGRQRPMPPENSTAKIPDGQSSSISGEFQKKDLREYASIPTTTITGSDLDPKLQLEGMTSQTELRKSRNGSIVHNNEVSITPSPKRGREAIHNGSTIEMRLDTTSSRHTEPRSVSENSVLARETPETDTASTGPVMWGTTEPPFPAQGLQTSHHYPNPEIMPTTRVWKTLKEGGVVTLPQKTLERGKDARAKEFMIKETSPPQCRQGTGDRVTHQRRASCEHRKVMIQEAARIAIQRSRIQEIVTMRNHAADRTPGPTTRGTQETTSTSPQSKSGGVNADLHSIRTHFVDTRPSPLSALQVAQHRSQYRRNYEGTRGERPVVEDGEGTENKNNRVASAIVLLASLLTMIWMVLLGVACTWWATAQPAFDQSSQLWRRRRRGETTWGDVGVFTAAGMLCVLVAPVLGNGVRIGIWACLEL